MKAFMLYNRHIRNQTRTVTWEWGSTPASWYNLLDSNQFVLSSVASAGVGSCPSSLQDTNDMTEYPNFTHIVVHTF